MFELEEVLKNFKGKYYIPNDDNEVDYKQLYEQQKQRADELEKRWRKLKEHFIKEKEQSFGILSWSRNNGVLELIEKLEENNNA